MKLFSAKAIVFGPANMKKLPHNGPTNLFHVPGQLPKWPRNRNHVTQKAP